LTDILDDLKVLGAFGVVGFEDFDVVDHRGKPSLDVPQLRVLLRYLVFVSSSIAECINGLVIIDPQALT
jgi:hypothetical protein